MKYLIALFLLVSFTLPPVAFASTEDEYRNRLIAMIAELQALILQLQRAAADKEVVIETPNEEFSSIILSDDARVISHYRLSNPRAIATIPDKDEREFFARFYHLVPDEFDTRFKEVVLFNERRHNMDAFVETVPPYTTNDWRFGMSQDIFDFEPNDIEVTELFIHEFAHVLGYDGGKDTFISEAGNCHEYFKWGCPPTGSYVEDFINVYWEENTLDDFVIYENDLWTESERKQMFVSSYAATSPEEDFAESFTEFILNPKASGATLKDQKTNFFYRYPELITIRADVRSRL